MRSTKIMVCAGIAAAWTLAACQQQQSQTSAPDAAGKTESAVTDDLSPESNARYLADNKGKSGVMVTMDGLQYRVIAAGNGAPVKSGADNVTVTYKGALIDGTVFDQTPPGETATFPAGRLIPGWVEALSMMKEGDEWELVIPSELGFGASGEGPIPPNQTLVFQMKLMKVETATP